MGVKKFFKEWPISNTSGQFGPISFSHSQVLVQRFPKWYDKWLWAKIWAIQGQFKILTDLKKKSWIFVPPKKGPFWAILGVPIQWYQPTTLGKLKGFQVKNAKFTIHDLELCQNSWESLIGNTSYNVIWPFGPDGLSTIGLHNLLILHSKKILSFLYI